MTLQEFWQNYRDKVIPKDAGPNQLRGTEMAFYAGAWSVFQILKGSDFDKGEEPTDADLNKVEAIEIEAEARMGHFMTRGGKHADA